MSNIEDEIRDYFKNKREVIAVYLFGSYAAGKEQHFSDIDIGILLEGHQIDSGKEIITKYLVELARILRKDIHPVILNLASEELLKRIFQKGKCILTRDSKKLARFRMMKFVEIADFSYYRDQMQSGLIRKVMEGRSDG